VHKCGKCHKEFSNSSNYKRHEKDCTGPKSTVHICPKCHVEFSKWKDLTRHLLRTTCNLSNDGQMTYTCSLCNHVSVRKDNHDRHIQHCSVRGQVACVFDGCEFRAQTYEQLTIHLNDAHAYGFEVFTRTVANEHGMQQLKTEIENRLHFNYRKLKKKTFVCNRTGSVEHFATTGERAPRTKGLLRSNITCPCFFTYSEMVRDF
jgi:hypothetical protein